MVPKQRDTSWKIVNKEPMGSHSLVNIFRLLFINKFRISLKYIPRFLWALSLSFVTLPLRIIEKIRYNKKIKQVKLTKDPIFIIGFFRTGTTYLHILLSKDDRLGYMSNLDVFIPLYNLSFSKLARKVFNKIMPETRPMDNIKLIPEDPQEEHYAVASVSKFGVSNALIFPKNFNYFTRFLSFEDCTDKELQQWKRIYHSILQKITLENDGKQLILKNPANACRIKYLLEMYPNAKFIYTFRNPYTLFPSMKIFFEKLLEIYTLQNWDENKIEEDYLKLFNNSLRIFERDKELIPKENYYEMKYEDFIHNPMPFLEEIYTKFNLDDYDDVKNVFEKHILSQNSYSANKHELSQDIINIVNKNWDAYRIKYGYKRLEPNW